MSTVKLRFSALPSHVRTARLVAAAVARRAGVEESILDEVRLAVGEACSRAVGLHRRNRPDAPVMVTLIQDPDRFAVEVADCVPPAADSTGSGLETIAVIEETAPPVGLAEAGAPAPTGGSGAGDLGREAGSGGVAAEPVPRPVRKDRPSASRAPFPEESSEAASGSMGLAVISGLVDDLAVRADSEGAVIRMSWPVGS